MLVAEVAEGARGGNGSLVAGFALTLVRTEESVLEAAEARDHSADIAGKDQSFNNQACLPLYTQQFYSFTSNMITSSGTCKIYIANLQFTCKKMSSVVF